MNLFKNKNHTINLRKTKKAGFLAVEILVAASIITVSVLAATAVAQKAVFASRQSLHTTQAAFLLEEGAEAVRSMRDDAWINISSLTAGTEYRIDFSGGHWTLTAASPTPIGIFTRKVVASDVYRSDVSGDIVPSGGTLDPGTRLITINVYWNEGGNVILKTLSFYISDIF